MIQTAKVDFKGGGPPSGRRLNRKAFIGLAAVILLAVIYLYSQHQQQLADSQTPSAPTRLSPVPANGGVPAHVTNTAGLAQSPTNVENHLTVKSVLFGLADSLMAVLSPAARAETVQPEIQTVKIDQPVAVPAGRQPLRVAAPLTDTQKLLLVAQASFNRAIDMANYNRDIFGFAPDERLDLTRLGPPIPVYTIAKSDKKNYQLGQPVEPLLQATNEWVFPAILNHEVRFMIPVRRVGKEFVADTTSRSLAMVYQKIQERWPAGKGYHTQFVVYPNIAGFYFTIPELPDQNLTDTSEMFEYNPTLSPASVILASWE